MAGFGPYIKAYAALASKSIDINDLFFRQGRQLHLLAAKCDMKVMALTF